ncbi:MAG: hypothetical protein QW142_03560, partial [Candidatus Bathyarchaeia archaeon]
AIKMLKRYNAEYILVYTTIRTDGSWAGAGGDEGKWIWMAAISGKARDRFISQGLISEGEMWTSDLEEVRQRFGNYTLGWHFLGDKNNNNRVDSDELQPTQGQNSTIYKLMRYAAERWLQERGQLTTLSIRLQYFSEAYIAGLNNAQGYGGIVPLVCLYKINYPPEQ